MEYLVQKKLSLKKIIWIGLIFMASTFTALEVPFTIVFSTQVKSWQVIVDILFSVLFIIDLNLHMKEMKEKKEKHKSTFLFAFDIICCIPFDLLTIITGHHALFQTLRLVRMLRIFKIYTLFKSLPFIPIYFHISLIVVGFLIVINFIAAGWVILYPKPEDILNSSYYIKALYWAITTVATVGYGDITPTDDLGRIYASVVMIIGVGMYTLIIGNVTRMMAIRDRHKDQSMEKMNDLLMFMDHYQIPKNLRESAVDHYHHILTKRLSQNDEQIIADLPHALQTEMQLYMKIKLISQIPIFKDCPIDCLKEVSKVMVQKFYSPGDTVIKIGDVGHELFIIAHGMVDVSLENDTLVASLHDGQCFGEVALLEDTKRNANVKCREYTDLYVINREHISDIISKFSAFKNNLEQLRKKRS